jgi:hypothetical protein
MSKKEGKRLADPSAYNILVTDGGAIYADYYVTFEPIRWRTLDYHGSAPGEALEVVVDKKSQRITRSYWRHMEGR